MIFDAKVSYTESPCLSGSDSSSTSSSCERASVHLSDGTIFEADMVIGADGQHSTVRSSIQEKDVKPKGTGTIVLSGNIPISEILEDDVLKTKNVAYSWVYWFGPRRCFMGASSLLIGCRVSFTSHIVGYPIVGIRKVEPSERRLTLIPVLRLGIRSTLILGSQGTRCSRRLDSQCAGQVSEASRFDF